MMKLIFRILLFGLGLFTAYSFGGNLVKTLSYRMTGETVDGRIIGFLAGRNSPSIQEEPTGLRKGKIKARRPVFRYPKAVGSTDSVTSKSDVGVFFNFTQYELGESVTVVYPKSNVENGYIFGFQVLLTNFLVLCLGLFMLYIGVGGRL